jgi:Ca2+-transporting ATPase
MQEEMPFLMSLCVAYWKRKIMSSGCKGIVQKSSACLTTGFVTTICTDLARKLISQDELEETRKAIRDCQTAGVNVKFISQDDISVVRAAAIEFEILTENSEAAMLKGEDFRNFSEEERIGMVDQITAIGNCLPSDKLLLMQCLKKKGNVVALTGANDLHDTPALRQADIGFVKADWGTKMARGYLDLMVYMGWNLEPSSQHHKMRSMLIQKHSEIHPTRANHDPIWVIDNYHLNNTIRRSSYDTNSVVPD